MQRQINITVVASVQSAYTRQHIFPPPQNFIYSCWKW